MLTGINGTEDIKNLIVMIWICLKDKNDNKIYTDDLINDFDGDGLHKVIYHEDSFCLERLGDGKKRRVDEREWWDTLEVIGNIHENKELLRYRTK